MGARVVRRHVLDEVEDEDLRVYMVWLDIREGDSLAAAEENAARLRDSRVTHYWIPDDELTKRMREVVGMSEGRAWDVFLLYDRHAAWGAGVPHPSSYMHQSLPLPEERSLDARKLADEVRDLLSEEGPGVDRTGAR